MALLARSWGLLGRAWVPARELLEGSWGPKGSRDAPGTHFGPILGYFGVILGSFSVDSEDYFGVASLQHRAEFL